MRFGDLNGDGRTEILLSQGEDAPARRGSAGGYPHEKTFTCLTALDLHGNVLWQQGTPRPPDRRKFHGSGGVLVHDLNGDGAAEIVVLTARENLPMIELRGGRDGSLRAERETGANYNIIPVDFRGLGARRDVLIGTGLSLVFVYDENLEPIWDWSFHYGGGHEHAAADLDGRGRDDVFIGVSRLDATGKRIWWRPDLDDAMEGMDRCPHLDHVHVVRLLTGEPESAQVLWLGGRDAVCLDAKDGSLRWRVRGEHLQECAVGRFDPDSADQQIYMVEKGPSQADRLVDAHGREVWRRPLGRCRTLRGWGQAGADVLMCWQPFDEKSGPYLANGRGEAVAGFDFPHEPASRIALRQERPADRDYGVKAAVFDLDGDGEQELVLFSRRWIHLYKKP